MTTSPIYRSAWLYELAMLGLYGRHYGARYRAVADLVDAGSSVLDLACGPAVLFHRYLADKSVTYTGLDINRRFVERLVRRGAGGRVWDLRADVPLPEADAVIMQASLYHFLPDARPVVDRMMKAARRRVIIAEPIRNVATSRSRLVASLGRILTNAGSGPQTLRFTERTLDDFFSPYAPCIERAALIAGGREKVYVLNGKDR